MGALLEKIKENPDRTIVAGLATAIVVAVILVFSLPMLKKAETVGGDLGKKAGAAAGYVSGVASADTAKAEEEGKQEALTNPETDIRTIGGMKLQETGKLDVLVAGIKLDNFHGVENKYAALYLIKADAIFSVDLSMADVKWGEDGSWAKIIVPQPEVTVYFDESETEKIAEWQKNFFSGSADDGFQAYLSTMEEIEAAAPEDLVRKDTWMKSAREAAEQQIKLLAGSIYGADVAVTVEFQ